MQVIVAQADGAIRTKTDPAHYPALMSFGLVCAGYLWHKFDGHNLFSVHPHIAYRKGDDR